MEDKCGPRASEVGIHPPRLVIPGPERILPYGGRASVKYFQEPARRSDEGQRVRKKAEASGVIRGVRASVAGLF